MRFLLRMAHETEIEAPDATAAFVKAQEIRDSGDEAIGAHTPGIIALAALEDDDRDS